MPGSVLSPSRGSCCEGRGAAPARKEGCQDRGDAWEKGDVRRGVPELRGTQGHAGAGAPPGPYLRELLVLALGDDRLLPEDAGAQIGGRRRHGRRVLQGIIVAEGAAWDAEGQRHPARAGPTARLQRCGESAALSAHRCARPRQGARGEPYRERRAAQSSWRGLSGARRGAAGPGPERP